MKKVFLRTNAFLLAFLIIFSVIPAVISTAATNASVEYAFIGDNAQRAGYAQGIITVTPGTSSAKSGYYLVYYTDGSNVLSDYDELASFPITGNAASFEIPDGIMIPTAAKGIAVFESQTDFLDNAPNISQAVAKAEIPSSKRLTLGVAEATFGAASDVHMNYEYHQRNARSKWAYALDFFNQNNSDFVIVTGDMTGDAWESSYGADYTLENQYKAYKNIVDASDYAGKTYESLGNHGNTASDIALFSTYTADSGEVHPYANSPYYYVLKEGKTSSARDNLFIFMWQELTSSGMTAQMDNFSSEQIDWVASVLTQFDNGNTNIFLIEHSPFLNYGAGDVYKAGGYVALTTFKSDYPQNMRLKGLLQEHKNVIVMSGHTHLTLYDWANYSDVNNEFARTVHMGSTCWPRAYIADGTCPAGTDGRKDAGLDYGSEAYVVNVYSDYIVYTGYNLTTGKKIPAACLIMPTQNYSAPTPAQSFSGSGTEADPYLIEDAQDFLLLTSGFNSSNTTDVTQMYGYGKYFRQTADIDLTGIKAYWGTVANGGNNPYSNAASAYRFGFAGTYDGNGYKIKVDLDGFEQRSVFPYLYGTLVNVIIEGSITSNDTAQPVRTSRGNIINCLFDVDVSAANAHGVVYSNYSYMYNVYSRGTINGTNAAHPVANHDNEAAVVNNIYHYYTTASGDAVSDNVGTRTNDVATVRTAFTNKTTTAYTTAKSKVGSIEFKDILANVTGIPENIALGKPFSPEGYYTTQGQWPCDYRASLTDGAAATVISTDNNWYGFNVKANDAGVSNVKDGVGTVIIDLQGNYTMDKFETNLYLGADKYGIQCPSKVTVSTSWDNVTYSEPVNVALPTPVGENVGVISADLNNSGRYVKVEYTLAPNSSFVFVNEIRVFGVSTAATQCQHSYETTVTEKTCTSQGYTTHYCAKCGNSYKTDFVDAGHTEGQWTVVKKAEVGIEGLKELRCVTCNALLDDEVIPAITEDHKHQAEGEWISDGENHWHYCECGEVMDKGSHKAGDWVTTKEPQVGIDGEKVKYCTVCKCVTETASIPALNEPVEDDYILGDVNKSGAIDMMDYILLKRNYFGTFKFDETQLKSGDVNHSGAIDMMDYILLKRAYFGTFTLQ